MKNVRLYHYKEGREGGVEPGWDIIVLECDCVVVSGWLVGCFSLSSVERILKVILILSAPWRCGRL